MAFLKVSPKLEQNPGKTGVYFHEWFFVLNVKTWKMNDMEPERIRAPCLWKRNIMCSNSSFLGSIRESSGGVLLLFFQTNDGSVENDRNWLYLKDFER